MLQDEQEIPLTTQIEQFLPRRDRAILTEARLIIPGGQAPLGFQVTATLTRAFSELPTGAKSIHSGGLCAIALAVIVLMTPAALRRIAYDGGANTTFFASAPRL